MWTYRVENDDGWFIVYKDGVEVASSENSDRMADVLNDAFHDANARIAELERQAARAKELLQDEMGEWLTVEAIYMPDHYLQLKQTIDVLDGGGE